MTVITWVRASAVGFTVAVSAACSTIETPPAQAPDAGAALEISDNLDARINGALAKLDVMQGLSVAVYTPDGVYARGFGVTDINTGEAATEDTAFYIASSTKSMLAVAMAAMHERGEIDLDASLADFAPNAPFPEETKPDQVTLRHLLSQSSGIINDPVQNRLAYSGDYDDDILWNLLAVTEPNEKQPPGSFKYTNYNYNILTLLVKKRLGRFWKNILAEDIFDNAGMTRTTAYMSTMQQGNWSYARPHSTIGVNAPKRAYLEKTDATLQSAGGVFMSATDAVKWLELLVEDGRVGGKQIVPPKAVTLTRTPHIAVDKTFGPYTREHYGLGFYTGPYIHGEGEFVHHFGGFAGTAAHVSYMPDQKVGVAVFANDSGIGSRFIHTLANYIYDSLTGRDSAGLQFESAITELVELRDAQQAKAIAQAQAISEREWTLSKPLIDYAGAYKSDRYGTITVSVENESLRFIMGNLTAVASAHTEPESVRVELIPGRGQSVRFHSADTGAVRSLSYSGGTFDKTADE